MDMPRRLAEEVSALLDCLPAPARPRARSILAQLGAFAHRRGIGGDASHLLDYDVIEAFCVMGCARRSASTRGTYRSVLYAMASELAGPPGHRATPFSGARALAPYSANERAELVAVARAQRSHTRRASAMAMVAGGIGAGLAGSELVALRGADVARRAGRLVVHVGGRRPRVVVVAARWAPLLSALATAAGPDHHLFRPGPARRAYKNFVNDFARQVVADPSVPPLSMGRGRASFICDHLGAGTSLSVLLSMAGIVEVESLARYARHVEGMDHSKASLRARRLAEGRP